ncbi:MAG: isochorismatase family cysteine hydrolase [Ilumatobacteraceae bacterium]
MDESEVAPRHVANTEPYAWPYDGDLDARRFALVVCGAQRRFAATSPRSTVVERTLAEVAGTIRAQGGRVVWVRHGRPATSAGPSQFLPTRDDPDWALLAPPAADDLVVDAAGWDGCYSSDLDHVLRSAGVRHVVLGGLASELTVDSTVRTLNDRGHECLVLTDGCAPLDEALGARAHCSVTMSGGIFGALGSADDLVTALSRPLVTSL